MKRLKNIINIVFDVIEVYIPSILFFIVFVLYVVMIAYRYIFYAQISFTYELSMILFMWLSILGASYGERSGKCIVFSILYDKFPEKIKLACRVIVDLLIICIFIILLPHAYESVNFMKVKVSNQLQITYDILYYPFLIFIILILIHHSVSLIKDIKKIADALKGKVKI